MRYFCLGVALAISFSAACSAGEPEVKTDFRIVERGGRPAVEVLSGNKRGPASPEEGLWSVAADWRDGWPAEWRHAAPRQVSQAGPWTILEGSIETSSGAWRLRDAYREPRPGDRVRSPLAVDGVAQGPRKDDAGGPAGEPLKAKGQILLPGIVYYGNPSGALSKRTPVFSPDAPLAIFEEHRYPLPFASLEWASGERRVGAALHSLPSPVPCGNLPDQWWSLGADASGDSTELVLLSGPCASNGQQSVVKAIQPGVLPYDDAWLNIEPGAVIEKTFRLEVYPVEREGSGFRRPLWTSLDLFRPEHAEDFPTFGEILEAKYRFAKQRWHETAGASGFKKYPDRPFFVIGWCAAGRRARLRAASSRRSARRSGRLVMAQRSLDFLSTAEFYEGGFHTWYNYEEKSWSHHEPLSQGQGMLNFARAVRAGRKSNRDTSKWEAFLARASDFHARRILRDDWRPRSTDEGFFIAPLSLAAELFDSDLCRRAAIRAAEHYAERHLLMREPYWGGTLDAKCEDKEGAYAAFQGFLAVYELTGEDRFLQWARHACDVVLTYLVAWDIDLPHWRKLRKLRLQDPRLDERLASEPAYRRLRRADAPDVYRLGQIAEDARLKRIGLLMFQPAASPIRTEATANSPSTPTTPNGARWRVFLACAEDTWRIGPCSG